MRTSGYVALQHPVARGQLAAFFTPQPGRSLERLGQQLSRAMPLVYGAGAGAAQDRASGGQRHVVSTAGCTPGSAAPRCHQPPALAPDCLPACLPHADPPPSEASNAATGNAAIPYRSPDSIHMVRPSLEACWLQALPRCRQARLPSAPASLPRVPPPLQCNHPLQVLNADPSPVYGCLMFPCTAKGSAYYSATGVESRLLQVRGGGAAPAGSTLSSSGLLGAGCTGGCGLRVQRRLQDGACCPRRHSLHDLTFLTPPPQPPPVHLPRRLAGGLLLQRRDRAHAVGRAGAARRPPGAHDGLLHR